MNLFSRIAEILDSQFDGSADERLETLLQPENDASEDDIHRNCQSILAIIKTSPGKCEELVQEDSRRVLVRL
jgi:hypothetical protein